MNKDLGRVRRVYVNHFKSQHNSNFEIAVFVELAARVLKHRLNKLIRENSEETSRHEIAKTLNLIAGFGTHKENDLFWKEISKCIGNEFPESILDEDKILKVDVFIDRWSLINRILEMLGVRTENSELNKVESPPRMDLFNSEKITPENSDELDASASEINHTRKMERNASVMKIMDIHEAQFPKGLELR